MQPVTNLLGMDRASLQEFFKVRGEQPSVAIEKISTILGEM